MFQDDSVRAKIALVAEMQAPRSGSAWLALLWSRLLPPAHVLAAHAGVSRSGQTIWWRYPSWLAAKLVELAKTVIVPAHRSDAMRTGKIKAWQKGQ